jgi:hypothetical protein
MNHKESRLFKSFRPLYTKAVSFILKIFLNHTVFEMPAKILQNAVKC